MAEVAPEADHFVICLFKTLDGAFNVAMKFVNEFEKTVRDCGGMVHLRADNPKSWEIFDGKDHFVEPNHLNPAIFDFNCISVLGFRSLEDLHTWWHSDEVHDVLSLRESVEKLGVFVVEGLQKSIDLEERNRWQVGDRMVLFEFMKISNFQPIQQYVDQYQRLIDRIGLGSTLLFAEGVSHVLMSEFPIDYACATSWRMKSEARRWYDTELYQQHLLRLRKEDARCLTILIPIFPDPRVDDLEKARKQMKLVAQLRAAAGAGL